MRFKTLSLLMVITMSSYAVTDFDREQIEQRIAPVGKVHVEQNVNAPTQKTSQPIVTKPESGQAIYEQYCSVCHRDGLANAPKFRIDADWKPRLEKKNISALVASAIKGLNAMPPKGTCQDCSDADLEAAIRYMVPKS